MEEVWKDVVGYEGLYQVSNTGKIRGLDRLSSCNQFVSGKIKEQRHDKDGYLKVTLCKDGNKKCHSVHRLVATAFIPNPNDFPVINHKDENPQNNNVDNLEWCTVKYNTNYGTCIQRRVAKTRGKRTDDKRCKTIYQYSNEGILINTFLSIGDASRSLNIRKSTIKDILHGRRIQRKEFVLSFTEIDSKTVKQQIRRRKLERPNQRKPIYQYNSDKELIKIFCSVKETAKQLGFSDSYIIAICKGKTRQREEYILSYTPLESV